MRCAGTRTPKGIELNRIMKGNEIDDGNGTLVGFTERERTEALHASEERYRTLFDLGPVAVYSCDVAGVIQEFNRRAAELGIVISYTVNPLVNGLEAIKVPRVGGTAIVIASSGAILDPLPAQQPRFSDLRNGHIGNQCQ